MLLQTEQNKCNARVQARDGMLRKFFCIKYLYRHVIDNHISMQECQLNLAKSREVKDNSYKLFKNQQ